MVCGRLACVRSAFGRVMHSGSGRMRLTLAGSLLVRRRNRTVILTVGVTKRVLFLSGDADAASRPNQFGSGKSERTSSKASSRVHTRDSSCAFSTTSNI